MSHNQFVGPEPAHPVTYGVEIESKRQRFESERMTRRQALRRIGVTTGIAVFGLLTVDDLARVSAAKLQEYETTRKIGESLSKEFQSAGIARADAGTDCMDAQSECNSGCGPVPWGCNPSGGSPWPQCWLYNICLIECGAARRRCDEDAVANGE